MIRSDSVKKEIGTVQGGKAALPVLCGQVRRFRLQRGLEQKALARRLGITANAVSNWEQGRSRPDVSLLPRLCEVLGVSLYDLFGLTDPQRANRQEAAHLLEYRALRAAHRHVVDTLTGELLRLEEAEDVPNLLRLPYFEKPLAAGIGDPSEFEGLSEPMYLYDSEEYRRADYIFRINGDSMEPEFCSGDLVLVERVPSGLRLREGEIGAFIVGNEMYIKEYRTDGLHSLNPNYSVLRFDEDQAVYLIGRVLTVLDPEMIAQQSDVEKFRLLHE